MPTVVTVSIDAINILNISTMRISQFKATIISSTTPEKLKCNMSGQKQVAVVREHLPFKDAFI